jgi:hypothetical protein
MHLQHNMVLFVLYHADFIDSVQVELETGSILISSIHSIVHFMVNCQTLINPTCPLRTHSQKSIPAF